MHREETHGREVGTLLARLPGQEFWVPRCARAQPLRLLQLRIKQNLLFDLQGIVSMTAPREINVRATRLIYPSCDARFYANRVTIIELTNL